MTRTRVTAHTRNQRISDESLKRDSLRPQDYKYEYTFSAWREEAPTGWRFQKGKNVKFYHGGTPYMGHIALSIKGRTKQDVERAISQAVNNGYLDGPANSSYPYIHKRGYD